ncbi:MAG: toll/interleukin-1 receptor domain-containing protein, partial [Nitrosomonas sp.]|nr:toll/interleukin-1 receptor domain-containing protein [Nitrosomonas sp.]
MTTVFISYSRDNLEKVKTLVHDLGILGHEPWFDQELAGGQSWWDHITSKILESELFVYVLSLESLDSHACKSEFMYAKQLGKNILPVLVDQRVDIKLLPPGLAKIHFVDYRTEDKAALGALARAIATLPIASAMPDPLPEPPPVPVSYLSDLIEQINTMNQLSFKDQTGIFLNLKRGLSDPKDKERIVALLKKLRSRKDLFAAVAEEIDALLHESDKTSFGKEQATDKATNNDFKVTDKGINKPLKKSNSIGFNLLISILGLFGFNSARLNESTGIEQKIMLVQICFFVIFLSSFLIPFVLEKSIFLDYFLVATILVAIL